jgi:hypothetical protein
MKRLSAILVTTFLAIISASNGTDAAKKENELNPAEKWVVARVTAGEEADLSQQFPSDKDRKLSAHFLEDLVTGTLPDVKVHRHGVRIIGATIDEPIDLENAQIRCEVLLDHCQFNKSVTVNSASFAGSVSFDNCALKAYANFNGMKVGAIASFKKSVFDGSVNFVGADIAGEFQAREAKFQNKEQVASFNGVKVGGNASFKKAIFDGPVSFIMAEFGSWYGNESKFQNGANFDSMKVRGDAFFKNALFKGPVSFSYADFAWLDLSSAISPEVAAEFRMQGMSYKYVRAAPGNEPESHNALLKLADQSAYTVDVYSNLEEFFLRQGYREDADRAFIAGKRRERKENLHGLSWLGSWLLDGLVGYGRRPWQAGIPCAVLVALGCVLFSPKKMEPQKPEDTPRVYSRFWYSLGLFLPFVDLQADKVWKPKADQTFLRNYMRVHIMLGWILIPIVLAALTGLIK